MPTSEVYSVVSNPHTICNKTLCKAKCYLCGEGSECLHSYVCSCAYYSYRNFCKHIHLVNDYNSHQLTAIANPSTSYISESTPAIDQPITSLAHPTSTSSNESQSTSNQEEINTTTTANIETVPSNLNPMGDYNLRLEKEAPYSKINSNIKSRKLNIINSSSANDSDHNYTFPSVTKISESHPAVIKLKEATNLFINGDIKKAIQLTDEAKISMNLQLLAITNNFPKETNKRTCEKQPRGYFPRKKKNKKPLKKPTLTVLQEFLQDFANKDIDDRDWALLLSFPENKIDLALIGWKEEDVKKFRELEEEARSTWLCIVCKDFSYEKLQSDYYECEECQCWFHGACGFQDGNEQWKCNSCK